MDPNATLDELRDILGERDNRASTDELERVAELFSSLDEWLSRGGFLPEGWAR